MTDLRLVSSNEKPQPAPSAPIKTVETFGFAIIGGIICATHNNVFLNPYDAMILLADAVAAARLNIGSGKELG